MSRAIEILTLALLSVATAAAAQSPTRPPIAAPTPDPGVQTPAALRADLDLLHRAIAESHPGAYRYRSQAAIDAAFDRAARRLTEPMDAARFWRVIAPVIAALEDGHTRVDLPGAADAVLRERAPLLPMRFHVARGRLYIWGDLREARTSNGLAGREVLSIDGRAARTLIAEMSAALEGDGAIPSSRIAKLRTFRFNTLYSLLYGTRATYRIGVAGDRRPVDVAGRPLPALNQAWVTRPGAPVAAPASFTLQDDGAVGTLTITNFSGQADAARTQRLDTFLAEAFTQMERRNTRALIIDLRGNGGGRDDLGMLLLSYLIDRPFTYYRGLYLNARDISFVTNVDRWPGPVPEDVAATDTQGRLHLISHPNLGEHQPAAHRFSGRVYILMDGGSFSTTAEFLSLARYHRLATFIGEEAGGGYYGNTSGPVIGLTLPNSRLRIQFPLVRYELAVEGFSPADRGVPPDHIIEPQIADLLAHRDRAMAFALSLARRP